ncbi:MAG TPA: hypothetical protein VFY78_03980 [Gammaproteobacteria bacterium]|nr:hypothetical protein [Gammaproteobacteria bacterium]
MIKIRLKRVIFNQWLYMPFFRLHAGDLTGDSGIMKCREFSARKTSTCHALPESTGQFPKEKRSGYLPWERYSPGVLLAVYRQ